MRIILNLFQYYMSGYCGYFGPVNGLHNIEASAICICLELQNDPNIKLAESITFKEVFDYLCDFTLKNDFTLKDNLIIELNKILPH